MRVRFWGTRGSIAKPGSSTVRYGGNTSCVEVRAEDGTLIVIDAGTGIHDLGKELAAGSVRRGHILIGHTHWDHIQGFPFFAPLFHSGGQWDVYAPGGRGRQLEAALAGQMTYEYSPITLDALEADVRFSDLREGVFQLGSVRVETHYLNHPVLTLAYRLEVDGAVLVYATDHEPHSLHPMNGPGGGQPVHYEDRRHASFLAGADLVIHDAQYQLSDFPAKAGWGHCPVERAVDYAVLAGAHRLALTHHDPDRDDGALEELCEMARERAAAATAPLEVFAAAEGQVVELAGSRSAARPDSREAPSALMAANPRRASTVLIVEDDPDMRALLEATLRTEGVRVVTAPDGASALERAHKDPPTLLLLDVNLPDMDGLQVCRALRCENDARLRDLPVVVLTGEKLDEGDIVDAFLAGATDYITKPVKPTLVRSRVRGWLLRTNG